jgi:acetyl-CoA C-acetyltransferase
MTKTAYIIDAVRTPRAKRKGEYKNLHPIDLLTYPLNALLTRNKIQAEAIEDVLTGCVTQVNEQAWCIGRAAVLAAGWPDKVPAATINRLCGSAQQACNFIAQSIQAEQYGLAIGAGVEHMTRVPMFSDMGGEESPMLKKFHPDLVPQGLSAEMICEKYKIDRAELDQYSYNSQQKASFAQSAGYFSKSLIPVNYIDDTGSQQTMIQDSTIRSNTTLEGLAGLKPAFKEDGQITAGNASCIVDGAAAVLLANEENIKKHNLKPRAIIKSMAVVGSEPKIMLTGPVAASELALKRAGLTVDDISLWEINEAFAPVVIFTTKQLKINPELVNVNGGGISLGHPLGATGAMLIGTALDELERRNQKYALITMCIGLGMGIATVIEKV